MNAVRVGVLGVVLFAATAASCTPGDYPVTGGTESTAQVCDDLGTQLPPLAIGVDTAAVIQGMSPDPTPDEQASEVRAMKNSYGQVSGALRAEAANAADPGLAAALADTADNLDAQAANIHTVGDIAATPSNAVDTSKIDPYCPDLARQITFAMPSG